MKANRWTNNHEKPSTIKVNLGRKAIYKIWIYIHYLYGYFTETSLFLSRIHDLCLLKLVRFCVTYAMNRSSVLLWAALSHSEINTNKTKTLATESICTKIDDYQNEPIKLLYVGCLTHLERILHTVLSKHENTLLIQVMSPKTSQRNTQQKEKRVALTVGSEIVFLLYFIWPISFTSKHSKPNTLKYIYHSFIFFIDKAKTKKRKTNQHILWAHIKFKSFFKN